MPDNMPVFTETPTLMSDGSTVTHVSATAPDGREHGGVYTSPDQRDALIAQLTEQIEARIKTELVAYEAQLDDEALRAKIEWHGPVDRIDDDGSTVQVMNGFLENPSGALGEEYIGAAARLPDPDGLHKYVAECAILRKALGRKPTIARSRADYAEMSIDLRDTWSLEALAASKGTTRCASPSTKANRRNSPAT